LSLSSTIDWRPAQPCVPRCAHCASIRLDGGGKYERQHHDAELERR
jgi:hypothetical protein